MFKVTEYKGYTIEAENIGAEKFSFQVTQNGKVLKTIEANDLDNAVTNIKLLIDSHYKGFSINFTTQNGKNGKFFHPIILKGLKIVSDTSIYEENVQDAITKAYEFIDLKLV